MLIAAEYPFLEILWTMLVFFGVVIWIWLLVTIFADIFRRHDISGWAKGGWIVLTIFLPLIGVLVYLGTQGPGMAERSARQAQSQQAQFDEYVRDVAGHGGPTAEIARAKELLDSGAISQEEFEQVKRRALS